MYRLSMFELKNGDLKNQIYGEDFTTLENAKEMFNTLSEHNIDVALEILNIEKDEVIDYEEIYQDD